jgi:hypothetical protein
MLIPFVAILEQFHMENLIFSLFLKAFTGAIVPFYEAPALEKLISLIKK